MKVAIDNYSLAWSPFSCLFNWICFRGQIDFVLLLCRSGVGWLEDATDAAWRHFLHRFLVFLSSCRLSRHPRARAPCGATSCHVMQGGDRDLGRHHEDCGGPSNERELWEIGDADASKVSLEIPLSHMTRTCKPSS